MLSIIIPTLNEGNYLPLLLESIKKQNFTDYEIIVADGDSEDKTREIAKKYGCKVISGGSPAQGRNEGSKVAKGELFFFIDADSRLSPHFLSQLIKEFERRKLDLASFPVYPQGNIVDKICYGIYNFWARITQNFLHHNNQTILIKRKIHQQIGGFDEEVTIGEDFVYAREGAKFGKFGFLENVPPVLTSNRRFKGLKRIKVYLIYILVGLYMIFFGKFKSNIFKYHNARKRLGKGNF